MVNTFVAMRLFAEVLIYFIYYIKIHKAFIYIYVNFRPLIWSRYFFIVY